MSSNPKPFAVSAKAFSEPKPERFLIKCNNCALLLALIIVMLPVLSYSQEHRFSAPISMGDRFNSPFDEWTSVISPDGLSFYVTSNRQGTYDIYVSHRAKLGESWGTLEALPEPVNTATYQDHVLDISPDGREMFILSNRAGTTGLADIYVCSRTDPNNDLSWSTPVNLGPSVNSTMRELGATYFVDPATGSGVLIMASNRDGGGVSYKLFQSTRNADGTFNAPTPINELNLLTGQTDPYIRRDGLEIFFAAYSGTGNGIEDIYVSTRNSVTAPWNAPRLVNGISKPFPSTQRSPKLSPDGAVLYFSEGVSSGLLDVYTATRCSLFTTDAICTVNKPDADFDGDGRTDLSVFRPSDNTWWITNSTNGTWGAFQFGATGDKVVSGDYDGDGRTDAAIFRPATGDWWVYQSGDNTVFAMHWGVATDEPVPADYDGDGKTDVAVFRDGEWFVFQSSNSELLRRTFGTAGDIPIPAGH